MTKYIWPKEGQTFAQAIAEALPKPKVEATPKKKKLGRPIGSKNKEGHKAGRKDIYRHSPYFKVTPNQIDPAFGRGNIEEAYRARFE